MSEQQGDWLYVDDAQHDGAHEGLRFDFDFVHLNRKMVTAAVVEYDQRKEKETVI